jgi:hypothetical protein
VLSEVCCSEDWLFLESANSDSPQGRSFRDWLFAVSCFQESYPACSFEELCCSASLSAESASESCLGSFRESSCLERVSRSRESVPQSQESELPFPEQWLSPAESCLEWLFPASDQKSHPALFVPTSTRKFVRRSNPRQLLNPPQLIQLHHRLRRPPARRPSSPGTHCFCFAK